MTDFTTTIYISGTTFTEFEVEALFEIETDTDGDQTWATSWELIHINMDGFKITRSALADMIGTLEVRQIEDAACDEFLEKECEA